jgi:hypothetical protein
MVSRERNDRQHRTGAVRAAPNCHCRTESSGVEETGTRQKSRRLG